MLPTLEVNDRLLANTTSYQNSSPQRGDVILFKATDNIVNTIPTYINTVFIKRVIALPGETVEVRDGQVYIDEQPLDEPYIYESPNYEFEAFEVPADEFFVLGDNRNNSFDSHLWGTVPRDHIQGKAIRIFWPLDRMGIIE